jgi:hypothetical protein
MINGRKKLPTNMARSPFPFLDATDTADKRSSRQKYQARSAVPFAVKLLQGFQVDGTWNVPTPFTFVGCVQLPQKISGVPKSPFSLMKTQKNER